MKKFSNKLNESMSKSISNDEIIDCLSEYHDRDSLHIEDGWASDGDFIKSKNYFSSDDLNKTRLAKLVTVEIGETGGDGDYIPMSMFNDISNCLKELDRFSKLVSSDIEFSIDSEFGDVSLNILLCMGNVKEEEINSDVIDGFLKEIKKYLDSTASYGKKRKKLSPNWLEMSFNNFSYASGFSSQILKINSGSSRYEELNEIGSRIRKAGFEIYDNGCDKQVVLRLRKIK